MCAHSWWALRFDLDTPLPGLEGTASRGLALLLSVAQAAIGGEAEAMQHSHIWDMALRCCWSLSTSHPVRGLGAIAVCRPQSIIIGVLMCLHKLVFPLPSTCERVSFVHLSD